MSALDFNFLLIMLVLLSCIFVWILVIPILEIKSNLIKIFTVLSTLVFVSASSILVVAFGSVIHLALTSFSLPSGLVAWFILGSVLMLVSWKAYLWDSEKSEKSKESAKKDGTADKSV